MKNSKTSIGQAGLTLVEALVTLVILSLGLIPSLAIISSSASISSLIKNNLIAANLAQEGVEVIRGLRDANWFVSPVPLPFETGIIGIWRIESDTTILGTPLKPPVVANSDPLLNPPLKFNSTTGLYNYSTGIDTNFRRLVNVSLVPNPCNCELKVVSIVNWNQGGRSKSLSVETHLFNWR